jgi:hypothetical protein
MNTEQLLRPLDPAPASSLQVHESSRKNALLSEILSSPGLATTPPVGAHAPWRVRSRVRTRLAFASGALALGVATAGAIALLPHSSVDTSPVADTGTLSDVSLASWTSSATALPAGDVTGTRATSWCQNAVQGGGGAGPLAVVSSDLRGSVSSVILDRDGFSFLCFVGSDSAGLWQILASPDAPSPIAPSAGVTLEATGSSGNGATGYTYAEGTAGSEVKAVTLTDSSRTVSATVENGRWTAWWPTAAPHGALTGSLTVTTTDGSVTTIPSSGLKK